MLWSFCNRSCKNRCKIWGFLQLLQPKVNAVWQRGAQSGHWSHFYSIAPCADHKRAIVHNTIIQPCDSSIHCMTIPLGSWIEWHEWCRTIYRSSREAYRPPHQLVCADPNMHHVWCDKKRVVGDCVQDTMMAHSLHGYSILIEESVGNRRWIIDCLKS